MGTGAKKVVMGRGLSEIFHQQNRAQGSNESFKIVPIEMLEPNKNQPRQYFDQEKIEELSLSIRESGMLQPIVVTEMDQQGKYEIVAGERRWRAASYADIKEVPILIKKLSREDVLKISLIENIQREDLTAIEEAKAYQQFKEEFGYTQEQIAQIVGKSRSHIANTLRLLNLPEDVKALIQEQKLTPGHARALLNEQDPSRTAYDILRKGLTVRQAERQRSRRLPSFKTSSPEAFPSLQDSDLVYLQHKLNEKLRASTQVSISSSGKVNVTIQFDDLAKLDLFLDSL